VSYVEWNVVHGLRNRYQRRPNRVCDSDFVEHIRISLSTIRDDDSGPTDSSPDIRYHGMVCEEFISSHHRKMETTRYVTDMVLVDVFKGLVKWHENKDVGLLWKIDWPSKDRARCENVPRFFQVLHGGHDWPELLLLLHIASKHGYDAER
jgi:hypothetical protein